MKKTAAFILSIALLFTLTLSIAAADGETWHCETCDADRDSEFCPICGAQKPDAEVPAFEATSWTCPTCGKELPLEYNFCPDDRTEQVISHGPWPVKLLTGTATGLKGFADDNQRHQSLFGPDSNKYPGAGAYKPYKVLSMTALFQEGQYVFADLEYSTVGRRCLYFKADALTNVDLEAIELEAYPAVTDKDVQPMFGPGDKYNSVVNKVTDNYTGETMNNNVIIPAGSEIKVFFESDNWVFAEFDSIIGLIRAWVPAKSVTAK